MTETRRLSSWLLTEPMAPCRTPSSSETSAGGADGSGDAGWGFAAARGAGGAVPGRPLAAGAGAAPTVRLDLERGIRTLPAEGRAVLVLHDIEGLAHAEVAALLSITEEASRTRLSRARRALREWLRSR